MRHVVEKRECLLTFETRIVAQLTTNRYRAYRTLFRYLEPIVKHRMLLRDRSESSIKSTNEPPVSYLRYRNNLLFGKS